MKNRSIMWLLSIIIFATLACSSFATEEIKNRYIATGEFTGTVFSSKYELKYLSDYGRWDPEYNDVIKAERLADEYLKKYQSSNEYYNQCVPKILEERRRYKEQYFGLINEKGEKIIWINYYWEKQDSGEADNSLYIVTDGGYYFFSIKVNLITDECFDLQINGEA